MSRFFIIQYLQLKAAFFETSAIYHLQELVCCHDNYYYDVTDQVRLPGSCHTTQSFIQRSLRKFEWYSTVQKVKVQALNNVLLQGPDMTNTLVGVRKKKVTKLQDELERVCSD